MAPDSVLSTTVVGCDSQLALSRNVRTGLEGMKEGKWPQALASDVMWVGDKGGTMVAAQMS